MKYVRLFLLHLLLIVATMGVGFACGLLAGWHWPHLLGSAASGAPTSACVCVDLPPSSVRHVECLEAPCSVSLLARTRRPSPRTGAGSSLGATRASVS